ncbi:hypothetical protein [Absidia glauca]|uniref:phosphatidate phosphatase n=1 Tax=Absidia glauca TaxID=4829 RepID=A0A163JKL1_ABSGL|nr:hypothetical protein [Absidia glauca]
MEYFGKLFSSVHTFYNELNPATLSGAIDIVVVKQADGQLSSSPFHVRFGKLSVLRPQEKKVVIKVNDDIVPYVMKVGDAGEAFFVFETDHDVPEEFQTSPLLDAYHDTGDDDSKAAEEPPFLDIGQAKSRPQDPNNESNLTFTSEESESEPEELDGGGVGGRSGPLELQSPKMIIEEQMDKVVTHLDTSYHTQNDMSLNNLNNKLAAVDLYQQPTNQTYPQSDGSTLLERVLSDPISTTTITKETFTIRPTTKSLNSMCMEVIRHSHHDGDTQQQQQQQLQPGDVTKETTMLQDPAEDDSIFLDIAGYKSAHDSQQTGHASVTTAPALAGNSSPGINSWGWGQSYKDQVASSPDGATSEQQMAQQQDGSTEIWVQPGQAYSIQLSLCGLSVFGPDEAQNASVFRQHQISFGTFTQNPNILNDKSLVFKHNDRYYATGCSGPFFTSLLVFKKPMQELPHYENAQGSDDSNNGTYRFGRGWRQWFSRSSVQAVETTTGTGQLDDGNTHHTTFTTSTKATTFGLDSALSTEQQQQQQRKDTHKAATEADVPKPRRNFAKTLRLTSDQLKSLPLKQGVNTISFSVTSAYQGTATCVAKLFLWDANIKLVVSDIDGTITKSDALGHVFTMIGKDWTHSGVAKLYTDVHHNGYQFLYLTSRAIGQADYTRDYLKGVIQGDYQLPDGPVLMSPDRLFTSFHREVIIRKPEVFKMGCLRDVRRLFGDYNPFYAGFGNRITDGVSYRSVDVPTSRIFTIDPHGEVKLELLLGFKSSYVDLNSLVDQMFPPFGNDDEDQTFNDWNFWKAPLPVLDLPPDLINPVRSTSSPLLDSKSKSNADASPKRKPIVPDMSSLPKESVIDTPPRQKSNILRRLTSRSSLRSTSSLPAIPSLSSASLLPPKIKHSSTSNLPISSSHSTPTFSLEKASPVKKLSFEQLDDDAFDATLDALEDEIDMDSIPFI